MRRCVCLAILVICTACVGYPQTAGAAKKSCIPPKPTYQPEPPPYHVKKNPTVATLTVSVNENGHVSDVRVLNSSGNSKYDRDALKTVKQWRFNPSLCDGKASAARVNVVVQSFIR